MSVVLHDNCKPGGTMCTPCEHVWTEARDRRGFINIIREDHPAKIAPGDCLECGHGKHPRGCGGVDFWGEFCGCQKFIPRKGQSGARA